MSTFIRDRKLGTTYQIKYGYHEFTDVLLRNLKDKFSSTNFIGIRVLEPRNASRFIQLYHSHNDGKVYDKIQSDWKKVKSFTITNSGYDAYFGMSALHFLRIVSLKLLMMPPSLKSNLLSSSL
jgi:hypothetical protein